MNIKEAVRILSGAKALYIAFGGSMTPFEPNSCLEMAAFGDFKVHRIVESHERGTFEIEVEYVPVREP